MGPRHEEGACDGGTCGVNVFVVALGFVPQNRVQRTCPPDGGNSFFKLLKAIPIVYTGQEYFKGIGVVTDEY